MSRKRQYIRYAIFFVALVMFLFTMFRSRPSTRSLGDLNEDLNISIIQYSWKQDFRKFYIDLEPPMHLGPSYVDVLLVELELENIASEEISFLHCYARDASGRTYESNVFTDYDDHLSGITSIGSGDSSIILKAFEPDIKRLPLSVICAGSESVNQIASND